MWGHGMQVLWSVCASLYVIPLLVGSSHPQPCIPHIGSSTQYISAVLDTLQCNNDYTSHVRCTWEGSADTHSHTPLQLRVWDSTTRSGSLCVAEGHSQALPGGALSVGCRYDTKAFAIGTTHTFYFQTACTATRKTFRLAQQLKVLPPVNLRATATHVGHLLQWESPYPPSSPLTAQLLYQLAYRTHGQDWTVKESITNTTLPTAEWSLLPGYRYEARVRAQVREGMPSDWSPLVEWMTEDDVGVYGLQCVLDEETKVTCHWEMRREQAQFLSHQLCCLSQTHTRDCECCVSRVVRDGISKSMVGFSCTINSPDAGQLSLELTPIYNSKRIRPSQHIQPPSPGRVQVQQEQGDWVLSWTRPDASLNLDFTYQLRYWTNDTQDAEGSHVVYHELSGVLALRLPAGTLRPSSCYLAQVCAHVNPREGQYAGTPSAWSQTAQWLTHPEPQSVTTIIYVFIGVFVGLLSFALYASLPACHRRVVLWRLSTPSPTQSKVLKDALKQSPNELGYQVGERERTSICIVQPLIVQPLDHERHHRGVPEEMLYSSSDDGDEKTDEVQLISKQGGLDGLDHSCPIVGGGPDSEALGISFSGPYILCCNQSLIQPVPENHRPCPEGPNLGKGDYVLSPPTFQPPANDHVPSVRMTNEDADVRCPHTATGWPVDPPAYTATPPALHVEMEPNHSGYCLLPRPDSSEWVLGS